MKSGVASSPPIRLHAQRSSSQRCLSLSSSLNWIALLTSDAWRMLRASTFIWRNRPRTKSLLAIGEKVRFLELNDEFGSTCDLHDGERTFRLAGSRAPRMSAMAEPLPTETTARTTVVLTKRSERRRQVVRRERGDQRHSKSRLRVQMARRFLSRINPLSSQSAYPERPCYFARNSGLRWPPSLWRA